MCANIVVYKHPTTFHRHFKQEESLKSPDEFTEFFKCLVINSEQYSHKCEKNELCLYEVNHNNIGHIEERRSNSSYSLPEINFSQRDQVVFLHFLKVVPRTWSCRFGKPNMLNEFGLEHRSSLHTWVLPSRRRLCDEQTNRSSRGRDSSKEEKKRSSRRRRINESSVFWSRRAVAFTLHAATHCGYGIQTRRFKQ